METAKPNFSSWLVASDIDGTLNNKLRKLPENNLIAINRFVSLGGKFTLASGRNPQSMWRHYKKLPLGSIPAVVMNGAGIYDFEREEMIYFNSLSKKSMRTVIDVAHEFSTIDALIFTKDTVYITGVGVWGWFYINVDRLNHKFVRDIDDVPRKDWGKVIFCGPPWRVRKVRERLNKVAFVTFDRVDSSIASVEILAEGTNKGTAIEKLADMMGVDMDHTCGIGDYYNDYEMLETVGVSGCCGQAPRKIKSVSEFVACHCNRGAVADFLDYIEKNKIEE